MAKKDDEEEHTLMKGAFFYKIFKDLVFNNFKNF